jgi:pyruvate formate lyase activating enzyme
MATVLFLGGCDFRCPFCHNPELAENRPSLKPVPMAEIDAYLAEKSGWIDGVVVTGGEPTLCRSLPELLRSIKTKGYGVKLDTNGTRPDVLKRLIDDGLVDFIAMDIKSVPEKYEAAAGMPVDYADISRSINLIISSGLDHEFRTTLYPPAVNLDDIVRIASELAKTGAKRYAVQQFNPKLCLSREAQDVEPIGITHVEKAVETCRKSLETVLR